MQKHFTNWFLQIFVCIHQTCKYKFSTGICKSGTCMQKHAKTCFCMHALNAKIQIHVGTGSCEFRICIQKCVGNMFLFIFACKYQMCKYKFQTCICTYGMCTKKCVFACMCWKQEKTCPNLFLQILYLPVKTCLNKLFPIVTCKYQNLQLQV